MQNFIEIRDLRVYNLCTLVLEPPLYQLLELPTRDGGKVVNINSAGIRTNILLTFITTEKR